MNKINDYVKLNKNNPFGTQAKMFHHLDRVYEYKTTGDTKPIFMEVNLTDVCNMKCDWCITDNRLENIKTLNIDPLKKFIMDFSEYGGKALTWSGGGEPTIYKYFDDITRLARDCNLELGLMTNGFFNSNKIELIGNNFKWVRFSLDTIDKDKYKKWKGVNVVDIVLNNIRALKTYSVKVGVNVNVNKDMTVKDIQDVINECYDDCDYIQFRPVLPRYFKKENIELNSEVWDYLKSLNMDRINLSNDKFSDMTGDDFFPFKSCEGHFFSPILDASGDIKTCMYHPNDNRYTFGNINMKSLKDIWESIERKQTIDYVRTVDYKSECQMCCKLSELNKFVGFINDNQKNMDINFL